MQIALLQVFMFWHMNAFVVVVATDIPQEIVD